MLRPLPAPGFFQGCGQGEVFPANLRNEQVFFFFGIYGIYRRDIYTDINRDGTSRFLRRFL